MQVPIGHQAIQDATLIADEAWLELRRALYVQSRLGWEEDSFPDLSFAEAERRSCVGRALLARLSRLDLSALPHDLALTMRLVNFRAGLWARQAEWYWTILDVRGTGQFGLFLPTAYCGGYVLNFIASQLASNAVARTVDKDRYLATVVAYARLIDQFVERTAGQAQRGIRMPKVQVLQARSLLIAFKSDLLSQQLDLGAKASDAFARNVAECVTGCLVPAFERALDGLSDTYLYQAPEAVGMSQYPQGAELYAELVKVHTTLELTAEQVHARGLERMAEIEESIRGIQSELGFDDDPQGFLAHLNGDSRWRAGTASGVTAMFQRYIDRLKPTVGAHFAKTPSATYGVAPLAATLERSMTYGYYDAPREGRAHGVYRFNAANLTRQPLFHLAALTYHELMPGHHLQFATQMECQTSHPFRTHSFVNAYIEGWAEYAATLAADLGLYEAPEERYGRLVMDAFLTSRLVVDTGMNVLGWSLERAREYMRAHSRLTEAEILTESVRYSCDIPGQALAYKLGDTQILALRERMRRTLGNRFAMKGFHTAVLEAGALPLGDLEWHLDHEFRQVQ